MRIKIIRGRDFRHHRDGVRLCLLAGQCLDSLMLLTGSLLVPLMAILLQCRECECHPGVALRCALPIWVLNREHPCGVRKGNPCLLPMPPPLLPPQPLQVANRLGSTCSSKKISQRHLHLHNPFHCQGNQHQHPTLMMRRKMLRQVIWMLHSYGCKVNPPMRKSGADVQYLIL